MNIIIWLKKITNIVVLGVWVLFALNINAQSFFNNNIKYIDADEGLSQGEVTSIVKDKKGFIWIGTRGGLNRYDGSTIKVFKNEIGNSNSLIDNSIETLFVDSKGHIWIGTKSNGVNRFDPEFNRFDQFVDPQSKERPLYINDKRIVAIEESTSKDIWLGTWQNGLYILNEKGLVTNHFLQNLKVNDILKTSDGNMLLATSNGAFLLSSNGDQLNHMSFNNRFLEFTSVVEDSESGLFYFGTWGDGLLEYNYRNQKFTQYNEYSTLNFKNAYYIAQDNERNLFIGTWGNGANYFNAKTKTFTKFNLDFGKTKGGRELYQDVLCAFQDDLGILWFGTNGGGVCKVQRNTNQFENSERTNLPNEPIWSIEKDNKNNIWVGVKGDRTIYYSGDNLSFFEVNVPEISSNNLTTIKDGVRAIYQAKDSTLWCANNSSLFEITEAPESFKVIPVQVIDYETAKSEFLTKITTLYQTSDKIFWIGTQQRGLRKSMEPGNPKNQTFKTYLRNERISTFFEDNKKRLWVGTYKGLKMYEPQKDDFKSFFKNQGNIETLSSDIIICIHEDRNGTLWVGTPNGLNKVIELGNGTFKFQSYQEKDGLPDSYIHAILEDDSGHLWFSTNKGITKFDISDNTFYNFDINAGLQSNTFMEGAAVKGDGGKFYFGGIYGISMFKPTVIKSLYVPPVLLNSLKVSGQEILPGVEYEGKILLNKSIEYNPEITLTHNYKTFTLEYATLDFLSNSGYSYKYKMEGLDSDWNYTTTKKNITYSNLDAGAYNFKILTTNNENNIFSDVANLQINVLPPFWKTWQAFIIYLIVFIGLLYLYRYFINQQNALKNKLILSKVARKKEEELIEAKTQFFTDIAHEFRTPLSLISGPVELMMDETLDSEQKKGYLSTVYYHTQRLLSLVNQLLDFRKIESGKMKLQVASGDFKKFSKEIFLSFQELAESNNIDFLFNVDANSIPLTYDRNRMEIVLCNLLSNAFKYSPKGSKIVLSIKIIDDNSSKKFPQGLCQISVKDNGRGMSEEDVKLVFDRFYQVSNNIASNLKGTGIGLALVKRIVERHGGEILIKSELGIGSEFIVSLPLGRDHFSEEEYISDFKKSEDPIHYTVQRVIKEDLNAQIKEKAKAHSLLIVEDNPEIRLFIKNIFQNMYRILEAENGKIGFKKATENIPDIIVSDVMMPEMDGIALCKALRNQEETMHIPIIMLTARTKTVFQEEGYSSGADIYVTKPFNANILKAQVQGLLNNRLKLKEYFSKKITLQPTEIDITSYDAQFLNDAMKIVEENLMNDNLNRKFLAQKLATSPSTLYRRIKSLTGQDTTEFIRSIRLKRAAQLIHGKQDNVSSIGYSVGFNDLKYFRECFKKQFGVSPSKYPIN